jgi:hypothetical protein
VSSDVSLRRLRGKNGARYDTNSSDTEPKEEQMPGGRGDRRVIALAGLERDVLIVACAVSAAIHAALMPHHLAEGTGPGLGFAVAALLLAGLAVALTRRPADAIVAVAGVVLAGLLASYALATTTGLPLLHPEAEPVEALALATKGIEAVGLLAATHVLRRRRPAAAPNHPRPKGSLT